MFFRSSAFIFQRSLRWGHTRIRLHHHWSLRSDGLNTALRPSPFILFNASQCASLDFVHYSQWSDGTSHLLLSPIELLEKLAAVVPLPLFHLLRYDGVLAPCARTRGRIVPNKPVEECTLKYHFDP